MDEKSYEDMIEIVPIETFEDVLENILISGSKKDTLLEKIKEIRATVADKVPETKSLSQASAN